MQPFSLQWARMWLPTAILHSVQCALFFQSEVITAHCYKSKRPLHISFYYVHTIIYLSLAVYNLLLSESEAHILPYVFVLSNLLLWSSHLQVLVPLRHFRKGVKKKCLPQNDREVMKTCMRISQEQAGCPKGLLTWIAPPSPGHNLGHNLFRW